MLNYQLATPYSAQIDLILTAPGIKNTLSAITIISETGMNMEAFPSPKRLWSWAGLVQTNNESAGKKKSVQVSITSDGLFVMRSSMIFYFSNYFQPLFLR